MFVRFLVAGGGQNFLKKRLKKKHPKEIMTQ
jgi:hypothetical protein